MPPATLSRCLFCGETIVTGNYCSFRCRKQGLKQAMFEAKADREIEAAGKESQQWISVDERLPEAGSAILVFSATVKRGGMTWIIEAKSPAKQREHCKTFGITHWQPLPAPPPVEQATEQERGFGFCRDCRNWDSGSNDAVYRTCKLLSNYQKTEGWVQVDSPTGTRFNFGCVAFLPREDAKG